VRPPQGKQLDEESLRNYMAGEYDLIGRKADSTTRTFATRSVQSGFTPRRWQQVVMKYVAPNRPENSVNGQRVGAVWFTWAGD